MKRTTSDLVALATEAFARHSLVEGNHGSDRWRIARVEDGRIQSAYATEIVSLWGGELYVGGDIDCCVFGRYADTPSHIDKLRWIGTTEDLDWYVSQKAKIGMSDSGKVTTEGRGRSRGPNARVVYAWAAVRRLCELLEVAKPQWETDQERVRRVVERERQALMPDAGEHVCPFCHGVDCDCRIEDFDGEMPGDR
jgi:hypothetical protein